MSLEKRLKEASERADWEENYRKHQQFKQIVCDLKGISADGKIPDELTNIQIAQLACPDCERTQKIIAYGLAGNAIVKLYSEDVQRNIDEILSKLKLPVPDVLRWWLSGARPEHVTGAIKPKKTPKNKLRDEDFKKWLNEAKPNLDAMNKDKIQAELSKRTPRLWVMGFDGWWEYQSFCKKLPGRKKD